MCMRRGGAFPATISWLATNHHFKKRRTPMHFGQIRKSPALFLSVATISILTLVGASARADVITDWNAIATTTIFTSGIPVPAVPGSRILAMTHAAIHDALNAIDRRYKPYALDRVAEPGASPEAAVVAAAHDVLF